MVSPQFDVKSGFSALRCRQAWDDLLTETGVACRTGCIAKQVGNVVVDGRDAATEVARSGVVPMGVKR